jgi:hypothetical protein
LLQKRFKCNTPFESPAKIPIPAVRFCRLLKLLTGESVDFPGFLFIIKSSTFSLVVASFGVLADDFSDKFKGASSASLGGYDDDSFALRFRLS